MKLVFRKKVGFTLIELLVVISVIAVLVSILLPALNNARLQAKMALCASNQHQILTALNGYQAEYDNKLPPCLYDNVFIPVTFNFMENVINGERYSISQQLGSYIPDGAAFACPASPYDPDKRFWDGAPPNLTLREAYAKEYPGFYLGSYNLFWNVEISKKIFDIDFRAVNKGRHTLMIADFIVWQSSSSFGDNVWHTNHPSKDSHKWRRQSWIHWISNNPLQFMPDVQQNSGYVDGSVRRSSVRDWILLHYASSKFSWIPNEWE